MSYRQSIALTALFFAVAPMAAFGQNAQTILPYDSPAISLLRSIYLEQGKDPLSAAGPFSIGELRMMLDKIDRSTLSPAGMRAYDAILAAIQTKPAAAPMALGFAAHPSTSLEGYFHTNPDPAQTQWQDGYNQRLPMVAVPMDIWIGDHIYGDFDLALSQTHDGVNPLLVPQNYLNWTTNLDLLDDEIPRRAFVAAGGDDWSFSIGRDRFSWGNGQTGDLFLSDAPDFQDFARLTLYWPSIKYTALWIMLYYNLDNYRSPIWGSDGGNTVTTNDTYPRNLFVHRLDFAFFNRLSFGVSEGILIGGIQPDLVYFNPLIIFHDLFRWGHASTIFSIDASYNPWKYFELYGQVASNKITVPYELLRYGGAAATQPDSTAYLGGLRARIPIWQGYLDTGGEAVLVGPWMYLRENQLISDEWWRWTNSNVAGSPQWVSAPLGYFTGPDAVVYSAWVGYDVPGMFTVGLDYQNIAQGQQTFDTTYSEGAAAIALQAPSGIPEYRNIIHLNGSVDVFPFLRVATDLYWIWVSNFSHVSGAQMSDFQATVSLTAHTNW